MSSKKEEGFVTNKHRQNNDYASISILLREHVKQPP